MTKNKISHMNFVTKCFFLVLKWKFHYSFEHIRYCSGKLKGMVETIVECGKKLEDYLNQYVTSGEEVEVREIFARFTTNVVASVGFGLEIDSFKDPKNEFREKGRIFFEPYLRCVVRLYISFISPFLTKFLKIRVIDRDAGDFMIETVKQNLKYREENKIVRKDFFQLLIQIRNGGKLQDDTDDWNLKATNDENCLSINDIAGQAFMFFAVLPSHFFEPLYCIQNLYYYSCFSGGLRVELIDYVILCS